MDAKRSRRSSRSGSPSSPVASASGTDRSRAPSFHAIGTRAREDPTTLDAKTDYEEIRYDLDDGRARITLARSEKHNAMTPRLLEELENALWEADDDCAVHCVVIHGKEDSFSSGYDLTALGGTKRPGYRTGRTHDDDIWLIGQNNRLQLTGDLVTGADAEKIGLVMKSVPVEVLEDEVEGLADRFSLSDPDLLAANKRITNLALELMGAARSSGRCSRADRRGFRAGALAAMPASVRLFGGRGVVARRPSSQLTST